MAIVYAIKSGNWSDPTVWNAGSLPTSADDVRSNGFTVNIDGSYTVLTLSNRSETSPVVSAGGFFAPISGSIIVATNGVTGSGSTGVIVSNLSSPESATINANITFASTGSNTRSVINSGSGTLIINGNITNTTGTNNSIVLLNSGTGTINLSGNCTGSAGPGGGLNFDAIQNVSSGIINVTGNVTGGGQLPSRGAVNTASGQINITGTVFGGAIQATYNFGALNTGSGFINVTGFLVPSFATALSNSSSGICEATGTVFPDTSSVACATNTGSGFIIINGTVQAGTNSVALSGANFILTGPLQCNSIGLQAIASSRWLWKQTGQIPTYMEVRTETSLAMRPLYTADYVGGNPAVGNVRFGTVYGPNNELTGTCRIPPASSVRAGVAVDNTVGTAALSPADLWNTLTSAMTTSGSIGERLKNAATVESVASTWAAG